MAKKAVLVGCNYPNTKAELHGCINDVNRIHKSLIDRFGFNESDITIMIDTDRRYTQPTGANIKRALNKLVTEASSGDILFFHYSGHGVRLPAETGEDDDTGYDECIVPCDMNLITDDDFREIVDKVPHGVILTLIADSCHSGGLVKNEKEQIGESSLHGGSQAKKEGGLREGLRGFISDKIHGAFEDRGIDLHAFGHSHSHHRHYRDQDGYFQRVSYEGEGFVKSRALPISTLLEILKQKTGNEDLDVGTIRPTLFDMFGQDSSSKVKKFVKVLLQNMHHDDDEGNGSGQHHHGLAGAVGALALQFMKHKLDEVNNSEEYLKPAMETPVSDHGEYAGAHSRLFKDMGVLVSGCQSSETSADANPTGNSSEAYGAMSNAVQTVLAERDGPITNHELVIRLRQILKKEGFSQRPGLYCTDQNANSLFVC